MSIKEGDNRHVLKNVNICLILMVGSRDLLHYVLCLPEYFIFHMKCFRLFFIKERKAEVARDERKAKWWKTAIPWTAYYLLLFSIGIYYRFAKWLTFGLGIWTKSHFFFSKAMPGVITPVLFTSGTLCLWLQPAEVKPNRDAFCCIIQTSPGV